MQLKRFFQDAQGRIVIGQWPNTSLWLAIGFFLLGLVQQPMAQELSFWGVTICLINWSYLEISSGVNRWRQLLGTVVMIMQIIKLYTHLL